MHADKKNISTVEFLKAAVAHYVALGVRIQRVLTDTVVPTIPASLRETAKP